MSLHHSLTLQLLPLLLLLQLPSAAPVAVPLPIPATRSSIDDSPAAPLPTSPTSEGQRSTQLNIACAKRVQSFLQAVFIEYGENKQFFVFF